MPDNGKSLGEQQTYEGSARPADSSGRSLGDQSTFGGGADSSLSDSASQARRAWATNRRLTALCRAMAPRSMTGWKSLICRPGTRPKVCWAEHHQLGVCIPGSG